MQKIAIIGMGFMGAMHAQCYRQIPNAQLVAFVDLDPQRAQKVADEVGLQLPIYKTLQELFKNENVDVVDICLPTDLHAKFALEAIAAGKNIFCEKPFALTVQDAKKVRDAARKKKVKLQIGQVLRFWPEYTAFAEFVKSKKAGKLLSFTLQRRTSAPTYSSNQWLLNGKRSGGAALDLHIHDTDFVISLLGTPKSVSSRGTVDKRGMTHIFTTYDYGKSPVVHAEGGWNYPEAWGFQMAFQAVFEKGTVEMDSGKTPSIVYTLEGGKQLPLEIKAVESGTSTAKTGNISSLGGYFLELQYFIDCLEKKKAPQIATPDQGIESVRVTLAEMKSALQNGKVTKV
ncbi:MAG: Gfo/Idh/MocA family oxidoreductase [Verrucomicrobiota bacterium]